MECDVEAALILLMETGEVPEPERVKELMGVAKPSQTQVIAPLVVNLKEFDALLDFTVAEAV
jgi:hypothetical protein